MTRRHLKAARLARLGSMDAAMFSGRTVSECGLSLVTTLPWMGYASLSGHDERGPDLAWVSGP